MKNGVKKILKVFYRKTKHFFEFLFESPAENQMRLQRDKEKKFYSYCQLKQYQKRLRRFAGGFALALLLLLAGIVIGPAIINTNSLASVYIPNGKGDILLGNISKNQATLMFKTLDSSHGNVPLATTAWVEVFSDAGLSKSVQKTSQDEYAVTHVIPVLGLEEGKNYYFKISAMAAANSARTEVSSWGNDGGPLEAFTAGDLIASCISQTAIQNIPQSNPDVASQDPVKVSSDNNPTDSASQQDAYLRISDVKNEANLYAKDKVQTIVSWKTNVPATTSLVYKEAGGGDEKEFVADTEKKTKHVIIMTTLKPGTRYYFKAKSGDESDGDVISDEYSLLTPQSQLTVVDQIGNNFMALIHRFIPSN